MEEIIIQLISGVIGTVAFAVLFGVNPKNLSLAGIGAAVTCGVYILTASLGVFLANMIASVAMTLYSEITARVRKAPVITFLTPAAIVLVPGSSLYYTVANLISENNALAYEYGIKTAHTCLGIAAGILGTSLIVNIIVKFYIAKKSS